VLFAVVSGAIGHGTAHDLLAALALPPLVALLVAAWLRHRRLVPAAAAAVALFVAAALVTAPGLHLGLAAGALAATLVLAALVHRNASARSAATSISTGFLGRRSPTSQASDARTVRGRTDSRRERQIVPRAAPGGRADMHGSAAEAASQGAGGWRDYVALTKPRIMVLLLITGFCGLVAGAGGLPSWNLVVATVVGLALACGGASALNHVMDRDIDRLMGKRTRQRPVAADRVPPEHALEFGLALSALSFTILAGAVNPLTALLALVGNLFYVLVYTGWLKRSTPQNIVIGGAAGAIPPLVGWAAATGSLALPALALFLIVFLWTPPHFWALALLIKRDYAAAGIPMLPVVRGDRETTRQIVLYSLGLVAFTVVPFAAGWFGALYLVAALALGSWFIWLAARLRLHTTPARASSLFHYSLLYLALLFVAVALDPVVM
jgi:protoheme IX farnesyltransferase